MQLLYLNFFISNKIVLVAKYRQEGFHAVEQLKDEKVKAVLHQLFPCRTIVQAQLRNSITQSNEV